MTSSSAQRNTNSEQENYVGSEKAYYEALYAANKSFAKEEVRKVYLADSEIFFLRLVQHSVQGKKVLEIGCGTTAYYNSASTLYVASDVAASGLAKVRSAEDASNLFVVQAAAESLPFANASFDLIIEHEAYSSLRAAKAISEVLRVLKPSGQLIGIESLGHNPIFNLNRQISALIGRRSSWAMAHVFKIEDLEHLKQNFKILDIGYFHLLIMFAIPLRKLPATATLIRLLAKLDLKLAKTFSKMAFKVVFKLEKI